MSALLTRNTFAAVALGLVLGGCNSGVFGRAESRQTPTVGERVPILSRIENAVTADPSLAATPVALPAAQQNAEWGQAGGNASKAMGHLALSAAPTQAWTAQIAGATNRRRLAAAPVVGGGRLFAIGTDGMIRAFDAATGGAVWAFRPEVAANVADALFGGGVTYADGRVYGTLGTGEVMALDAATGALLWQVRPSGPLRGSPTVAFNLVMVMTQDNQILALNAANGALEWQESGSSAQAGVFGVAAPAAAQGTIVAGYSSGELVAYRYENGRVLWSDALARTSISTEVGALTDIDADPIIEGGRVFALGQGGRMAAYDLLSGQRAWELNLAGISTPAIAGNWIFTLTDDGRMLAIARGNGRIRWITQLQRYRNAEKRTGPIFWTGPVLAGGQLWIANSEGAVMRVNPADGAAVPFVSLGQPVSLAPVVANGTLYILDDSGRITAWR
ncbi:pyrrolo-quinoline quinone [Erythrobacteraceae bacterium CFH 75059]|uniref:outer membrane protein assembly factor BamB family protein n=1 Tax=Qipengyuania thermophila TaxID=2509361 RepID=UPI0010229159|nr:PQQ-binding-like beta-propeller repeat protein [Qipengyuania thermophila]TCD04961.1 pyrrolo-quinoline quinone [Erythrobacteraceae bacterium CFH 75059]